MIATKDPASGDSGTRHLAPGQRVRVSAGSLFGLEGKVVEHHPVGTVMIQLEHGILADLEGYMLEVMDPE